MFSLSKIKNKKSFFLPIILFTAFHTQCGEGPDKIQVKAIFEIDRKEESTYWKIAGLVGPAIASAVIPYVIKKYYEDPETIAINKEEKKIELQTKSHPDYPVICIQIEKNKVEEKALSLREKQLEINIKNAQIIQHYEEKLDQFRKCDKPLTPDYCVFMTNTYQQILEQFIQQKNSQQ